MLAKQADKYSLIRSMTHGINAHETASYTVQTGRASGGRDVFPGTGAVVSLFKGYDAGYKGLLPPYIVLTELQGRFSEAGFLGGRYKPFATGGDPGPTASSSRASSRRASPTSASAPAANFSTSSTRSSAPRRAAIRASPRSANARRTPTR
jgi:hypothetical protein